MLHQIVFFSWARKISRVWKKGKKKWRSGSRRSDEELLKPVEWEYRNAYERIGQTSCTSKSDVPTATGYRWRCALRPRLYCASREQASENIHTTCIRASRRIRMDESIKRHDRYLALIARTTERPTVYYICVHAARLIQSTSDYYILLTARRNKLNQWCFYYKMKIFVST